MSERKGRALEGHCTTQLRLCVHTHEHKTFGLLPHPQVASVTGMTLTSLAALTQFRAMGYHTFPTNTK